MMTDAEKFLQERSEGSLSRSSFARTGNSELETLRVDANHGCGQILSGEEFRIQNTNTVGTCHRRKIPPIHHHSGKHAQKFQTKKIIMCVLFGTNFHNLWEVDVIHWMLAVSL